MGEIVQFPTNKADYNSRAVALQKVLNEKFVGIHIHNVAVHELEVEVHTLEDAYDQLIYEWASKKGEKAIPMAYLDFSKRITPVIKDGELFMILRNPKELNPQNTEQTDFEPPKDAA